MTNSRSKAIRIIIATAAVSLLLSAVCCAAFVLNLTGLMHDGAARSAQVPKDTPVGFVWCAAGDDDAGEYTVTFEG